VLGLGATKAVDYKSENYKASLSGFDVVFDCIGRENLNTCSHLLNDGGIYVSTVPSPLNLKLTLLTSLKNRLWPSTKRAGVVMVKSRATDLRQITDLIHHQQLRTVIDTTFPLAAAAQAHDLSRSLRAKGKIIIKVR